MKNKSRYWYGMDRGLKVATQCDTAHLAALRATQADARGQIKALEAVLAGVAERLNEVRTDMVHVCPNCTATWRVREVELVRQLYGYRPDDDGGSYTENLWYCCVHCGVRLEVPTDEEVFPRGFHCYVRAVHDWYSDSGYPHGRASEVLAPYLERKSAEEAEQAKQRDLQAARELLRKAGELPGSSTPVLK